MPPELTDTDAELLSAYLDGMLADSETAALEQRLAIDPALRRELAALRQTIDLIHSLPTLKAPRNFTLTPAMVPLPEPQTVEPSPALSVKKVVVMPAQPRRASRWKTFQPAAFAAAAVFVVAIGFVLLNFNGMSPQAPQIAAAPTNPPFTNMMTGSEADQSPQESTGATALETQEEKLAGDNENEQQSQAGESVIAAPTQAPATQALLSQTTTEDEQPVDILTYATTPLPEGMGGGGFQGSGSDYSQDTGLANSEIAPESAGVSPSEPRFESTRVTINTDPNAGGFTVRPADQTAVPIPPPVASTVEDGVVAMQQEPAQPMTVPAGNSAMSTLADADSATDLFRDSPLVSLMQVFQSTTATIVKQLAALLESSAQP